MIKFAGWNGKMQPSLRWWNMNERRAFFSARTCYPNEAPWVEVISEPEERWGSRRGCSHRRSVHHPVGSLLALEHHTVWLLPFLRRPEEENSSTTIETKPRKYPAAAYWFLLTHAAHLYCSLACITMKSHLWFIHLCRRLYCSWRQETVPQWGREEGGREE